MYGKLENGNLKILTGKSVRVHGRVYVNPTERTLRELGYKPVIETDMPPEKDGYYITVSYTEDEDNIYKNREYIEITEETEE